MINEYKFYHSSWECTEEDEPEEIFYVNDHKVSKDIYNKLYYKASKQYELYTTQECFWKNHISKTNSYSSLITFKKKEEINE